MSWRTNTYRELGRRLSDVVGGKTAAEFAKLGLATVDDLMRHVPRRYLAGTEMSDFGALRFGEDVAVVAKVHHSNIATSNGAIRVNASLTDDNGNYLAITLFAPRNPKMQKRAMGYANHWLSLLKPGSRGIFIGKVSEFNGARQRADTVKIPRFSLLQP